MKNYNPPTAIDVFSGCGGLTTGLKMAGFKVIGAIEIDDKARSTYTMNHPEVPIVGHDVTEVKATTLLEHLGINKGSLDLLAGCPPCQGFSTIRRRNKAGYATDPRNDLIDDFARLAIELEPKLIMMENVAGLEKYNKFVAFLNRLKSAGYDVIFKVLNVADFGIPQRRKRLILSASKQGVACLATESEKRVTVREAIAHLPKVGRSGDLIHDLPEIRSIRIQSLINAIPRDGGSRHSLPEDMQLACHKNTGGFNDVYGRMKWDDLAPTITGGCTNPSRGRFLHPTENRTITLREAAILQGFPNRYKFDVSHGKTAISLMIGNALPPPFIAAHAKAMISSL